MSYIFGINFYSLYEFFKFNKIKIIKFKFNINLNILKIKKNVVCVRAYVHIVCVCGMCILF